MAVEGNPLTYTDQTEISFLGRRYHCLDLSREISPDIPVYPGHAKIAFWTHLTYDEARFRTKARVPQVIWPPGYTMRDDSYSARAVLLGTRQRRVVYRDTGEPHLPCTG